MEEPRTDSTRHRARLVDPQGVTIGDRVFLDETEFTRVPSGSYVLKVFEMREGSREWDPGRVDPFRPPAHYFIQRNVPVERGLTGQVFVEWE
ncbi:MAG: hypothetical protein EA363_07960 [Balneolaceae bacterium]|nr:MAG: hypothetical protein EA363_07960 [Balneolaceae bacterium]